MMGIRGLTSFIDSNSHLLNSHKLNDVSVVIDGNNLCHSLYFDSRVDYVFGGDYDKFYTRAKSYLTIYKKCNIFPYVIFDGGYDYSDRKLRTTLERNKDRVAIARAHARGKQFSKRVLPVQAMEVLRRVLHVMGMAFAQCDFEADDQIVALANHLGCPVLSLDSDFYIFDIAAGFIPLDSIDTVVKYFNGSAGCYLECQIYRAENLLSCFDNLDRSVLPLFATLLGNDFVEARTFSTFFDQIKWPKVKCRRLRYAKRHCKMIGLLWWLQNLTVDEAIEQVLSFLRKEKRDQLRQLIKQTIQGYTKCSETLIRSLGLRAPSEETEEQYFYLATMHGKELPHWFAEAFCRAHLPPFMLNAVGQQRIMLQAQTEDFECSSSYLVSLPLRQVIYGVLSSHMQSSAAQNDDSNALILEYDRVDCAFKKTRVLAKYRLPVFGCLPSLDDAGALSSDHAIRIILETLDSGAFEITAFPPPWQLFLVSLHYWIHNANPQITEHHMNAALLCLLNLTVFKPVAHKIDADHCHGNEKTRLHLYEIFATTNRSISSLLEAITEAEASATVKSLDKFNRKPEFSHVRTFSVATVHGFAQLQTCLLYTNYLNLLLGSPYLPLTVETCFNGTFLYNMCVNLSRRTSPDVYFLDLLGRQSSCYKLFLACQELILASIGINCFKQKMQPIQRSDCKRKIDCSAKREVEDDSSSSGSSEVISARKPLKVYCKVATENRFHQLGNYGEHSESPVEFVTDSDDADDVQI